MALLLDTHAFLWLLEGSPNLSSAALAALVDPANDVFLSVASVWEPAIKVGNQKMTLKEPLDVLLSKWATAFAIDLLPITEKHALEVLRMPYHHRDPFDRIMIAQALTEGMTIVTADTRFAPYGVPIIW
jgi:PIN domain nuclease of toxin-antitoxin system